MSGERPKSGRTKDSDSGSVTSLAAVKEQRLNYGRLPKPDKGTVPYANCREELAGLTLGDKVIIATQTDAWTRLMVPILDELEADRPRKGPAPAYTSHELELAVLFTRMAGKERYAEARALLAGDRGGCDRRTLGFDRPRQRVGRNLRVVKSLDGVPSEKTVWRHLDRFGLDRHAAIYEELLFPAIVAEHFENFPEAMAAESRVVDFDGSAILSHYSSFERKNRKTGEVKPPTLSGGGFRPRTDSNAGKDGHGVMLSAGLTSTGLPLVARIEKLNESEGGIVASMLREDWRESIAPHIELTDEKFGVMAFDAAICGITVRTAVHEAGYIPTCHPVSHALRERSKRNARAHDKYTWAIEGKPGWKANGHREVMCAHGTPATKKDFRRKKGGEAVARIEGSCSKGCGHISITAGEWRAAQNPKRFVRVMPGEEDRADWKMGNPLTFNSKVSESYGTARFGHNEGFHGALVTRFGLLKEKTWRRSRAHVQRDFFQTFFIMHALAMEQRRRAAAKATASTPAVAGGAPTPPLASAAWRS